jgi:aspartate/methionine/tyrosine aminotransferase
LRAAIAATYEHLGPDDVLCFVGAQEGLFWTLQELLGPGDHAVVTVPNYQSMESVPLATGAQVSGLPLWTGGGAGLVWTLDLERLEALLRPTTRVVAVNAPNNPTGYVPDAATFTALARLCDERGIRLFSDEVFRGLELDPGRRLPQAADLSERAVCLGVMSKAYGLPGLRLGWIASRDRDLLARIERRKHYTTICAPGPSEHLATVALRHAETVMARNRQIIADNLEVFGAFFAEREGLFDWSPPDGGCVAFPRYRGPEGAEELCRRAVEQAGVILLPPSLYASSLTEVPTDRFRIGVGRRDPGPALAALATVLPARRAAARDRE